MQSAYTDPKKKTQLVASFAVIAAWARETLGHHPDDFRADLKRIATDADRLRELSRTSADPAEAMRKASALVHTMDAMIDLEKELHEKPGGDSDRGNERLRTALRRVRDVRNKDVWHIQLT
jgi:hypothetical protein